MGREGWTVVYFIWTLVEGFASVSGFLVVLFDLKECGSV